MSKAIYDIINDLPTGGPTVMALKSLDAFVPGGWDNITNFEQMIRTVTGETDEGVIQQIGDRAVYLYNDKSQGYQRAIWLYNTVDSAAGALATASMVDKVGGKIPLVGGLLSALTPKPETAQSIDLTIKLVTELLAFTKINGIPGDSIGDFLAALGDYGGESLTRMAALVCFDGLIPLGPNFLDKALNTLQGSNPNDLSHNRTFKSIEEEVPGSTTESKKGFIAESFSSTMGWMGNFVGANNLTQQGLIERLRGFVEFSDDKVDYLGALLDILVKYYSHTGAQTVGRRLVERAVAEI
ncbi:MAG TPA: hypothetical protein IGS53_02485 [Leptolyngbyaceae cyanobacterium M33_DOE_097]|uniref:Uncharacterized protein n=1 Tax=Oscillatoriales cyanobacterium SpSt-418 TaxID=2282169 RepID=A0A7C3PJM2_9CYAN|nr:hypothetical protein [Leptolyngbyaceae cyanobacterium M33_DOE_097]